MHFVGKVQKCIRFKSMGDCDGFGYFGKVRFVMWPFRHTMYLPFAGLCRVDSRGDISIETAFLFSFHVCWELLDSEIPLKNCPAIFSGEFLKCQFLHAARLDESTDLEITSWGSRFRGEWTSQSPCRLEAMAYHTFLGCINSCSTHARVERIGNARRFIALLHKPSIPVTSSR